MLAMRVAEVPMPDTRVRRLFVDSPKKLEVGFYTSSIDKFLQARLVLQKFGLVLRHFASSQEPYHEEYSLGQAELLRRALDEIKRRLGVNSLFFVEDTSVRLDALSSTEKDVPGLEIKEWFAKTNFHDVDLELRRRGNIRSATVHSDIALHVPGLSRPVFIHGETQGHIAETPPSFGRSDQFPWLTPATFNGWFIPNGATQRLGEMSFEESWRHDFRVRALVALVDRLEEYAAALNLDTHSYSVKRPRTASPDPGLFEELYIIVGKVCAGKTTLGQYMSSRHPYHLIEASSIMRLVAEEAGVHGPTSFYLARDLLHQKGPDIVARHIVTMYAGNLGDGYIISGLRTIEEVQYIRECFPACKVVCVESTERTRFERHLHRGRLEGVKTLEEFREHDRQQWQFGLLPVARDLADIRIENEGTIKDFHRQIEALLAGNYRSVPGVSDTKPNPTALKRTRLFRCLCALETASGPASCPRIAELTVQDEVGDGTRNVERISARHANWVLKDFPELARRVDVKGDRVRYEILAPGRAYLKAIRSM